MVEEPIGTKDAEERVGLASTHMKPSPRGRRRRQANYLAGLVILTAIILFALFSRTSDEPAIYAVKVDGEVVGYVEDSSIYKEILRYVAENESFAVGASVSVANEVICEKVEGKAKDYDLSTEDELALAISRCTTCVAEGYVVTVNGEGIVALCSEEDARGVIADLRANYISEICGSADSGRVVEEVLIRENIDIRAEEVATSIFRTREEAAKILSRGTDKVMIYTVKRGDSLWAIANANGMTLEEILKANPMVNADLIQIGQDISLVVPDPFVTLASREVLTYSVAIPFAVEVSYDESLWPWQETTIQAGQNGKKEIAQEVIRENGKEISRITLSEKVLSMPVTKKITRGSKQVPPMGSDDMVWPVQGAITSGFGWRWGRMHNGVDIGASTGTKVLVADSGMVSFAGWNGGYGYLVQIDHGGGKETYYGHLSKIACSVGQTVTKGDVIGYVGSTGVSTGPHLHFEVRINGTPKDPVGFYP